MDDALRRLASAQYAVIATDPTGRILSWNSRAEQIYGWTEREVLGLTTREVLGSSDGGVALQSALRGETWGGLYTVRHRDTTTRDIFLILTPIVRGNTIAGIIGISVLAGANPYVAEEVPENLTRRELDVLRLAARGMTSAAIAERLGIGRRTVETHRARVGSKLGFRSQADLVIYAVRHGLLSVD